MINRRGIIVLLYASAIMLGLWLGARHGYSAEAETPFCQKVRLAVEKVGEERAEQMARAAGASEARIAAAKACLKK